MSSGPSSRPDSDPPATYPVPPVEEWTRRAAETAPALSAGNAAPEDGTDEPSPSLSDAHLAWVAERWHELESVEDAEVLKSNPARDVIFLPADGDRPALVVKRYRVRGRAERWKFRLLPSRAAREWRALVELQAAGLPVPTPFAFFEAHEGRTLLGAGLVMEFLDEVYPLPDLVFADPPGEPARDTLLRSVGELVARVHAAGISHPDLHLGNFLGDPDDSTDVRLLDLHSVRHHRVIRAPRRRLDLAKLVHSLGIDIDRYSVRQVIESYLDTSRGTTLGKVGDEVARVMIEAHQVERIRLRSRDKRCWRNTSQFRREDHGAWRVHRRRIFPAEALAPLLDGSFTARRTFVERPGHTVAEVELPTPEGTRSFIVKVRERGGIRGLLDRVHRGPLARAWGAARRLEVRGLPHAEAQALLVERKGGAVARTILVTECLPGRTLAEAVRERSDDPRELERFLRRAADAIAPILRRLHRAGIHHRDTNPSNWFVVEGGDPRSFGSVVALLDLDSIHPGRDATIERRRRNLVQLALLPDGLSSPRLRARFLLRYHAGERIHRAWLRALEAELVRRQVEEIEKRVARESTAGSALAEDRAKVSPSPRVSPSPSAERARSEPESHPAEHESLPSETAALDLGSPRAGAGVPGDSPTRSSPSERRAALGE